MIEICFKENCLSDRNFDFQMVSDEVVERSYSLFLKCEIQ